jgi:glycosyltransferase involved in cell wall biosynthesis
MRIMMLAQSYSPIIGGEERVVEDLSRELARRGHDVSIATLRQPVGEPPENGDGVRVHTLRSSVYRVPRIHRDTGRRHAPPAADPETVLDLRRVLQEERPEIVHAHNWLVHSFLPLNTASGPALAMSLHDYGLICPTKRLLYRHARCSGPGPVKCIDCAGHHYGSLKGVAVATGVRTSEPQLRRHVDLFLPVSRAVRRLCRLGPEDRFEVIPNFIGELPRLDRTNELLDELPQEPFILFSGDITEDKGAHRLASVYSKLKDPPPLVLIGRSYADEIRRIPGIRVLGPWPHDLLIEALRRSLFTVAPSIWEEPFGLVALESGAAGKSIVASDIGGLRDIVVDGETGLLVPPDDADAWRAALERMISDDDLRNRLADAAARRAAEFSPEAVVPKFEHAYESAIETRRSRRHSRLPSRPAGALAEHHPLVEVTIPSFQDVVPTEQVDVNDPEVTAYLERLPDEPYILYVGAFRKVKGLETIFDSYRLLESAPPLVLIGTFERDSPDDFPPEAVVLSDVPHAAVMAAWDRALFGVMPSLWPEPFGATVAEAMNRGKPVIGTKTGGHTDMLDDTTGILVPQGDVVALAQAMEELIADPERREAFGRAAKARAETFAQPAVLPRFEQAYRDVVAAGNGEPLS